MAIFNKQTLLVVLAAITCSSTNVNAYTNSHDLRRNFAGMGSFINKKSSTTASTTGLFGPNIAGGGGGYSSSQEKKTNEPQQAGLSQAAINTDAGFTGARRSAPSSPLPNAAHGILSPETVARMDENTANGRSNPAVEDFLKTYRRKGPMSCLEMLSDPEILPHLTQAMRDIV